MTGDPRRPMYIIAEVLKPISQMNYSFSKYGERQLALLAIHLR